MSESNQNPEPPPMPPLSQNKDYPKAFDKPQDQYTCINLNDRKIAMAFIDEFLRNWKYFKSLDVSKLKIESRSMHDSVVYKDSYADIHYSIPLVNAPDETSQVIVLGEHKSYNDHWAIVQLFHYCAIVVYQSSPKYTPPDGSEKKKGSRLLPPVIPIIIYNGETPYSGPRRLSELFQHVDGLEKSFLDFEPIIIDLSTIPFDELPNNPNEWRLNAVLRALKCGTMKNPDFKEVEKNFQHMLKHYNPDNPEEKRFVQQTVRYYMDGSHVDKNELVSFIEDNYPITNDGVKNMTLTVAEQLIQQGFERGDKHGFERGDKQGFERGDKHGFERGDKYGFERGILTGRKQTLLTVLERKFKSVPDSVRETIQSIHDDIYLQTLFIEAMECQTLDEFCEKLL